MGLDPIFGPWVSGAFFSGIELGLMTCLADGPATAGSLARRVKANTRAVRMLLDALVGLKQLTRRGDRYRLAPVHQAAIECPGMTAEFYFADLLEHVERISGNWFRLTEVVKSGKPVEHMGKIHKGKEPFESLARMLFPRSYPLAKVLAPCVLKEMPQKVGSILDVGAGSAAWSLPFAEADSDVQVVALDFPPVMKVAEYFAQACGVEAQYSFVAGDLRRVRFGAERYDLVILGHICHSEGAVRTRRLFKKIHKCLRPRGGMVVVDFIVDDRRTEMFPLLFALNMLINTDDGDTFTIREYGTWAKEAGFRDCRRIDVPGPADVLLFLK